MLPSSVDWGVSSKIVKRLEGGGTGSKSITGTTREYPFQEGTTLGRPVDWKIVHVYTDYIVLYSDDVK